MTILNARLFSHQAATHPNTSLASMRSEAGWAPRRKTQKKATEQGKVSKPSIDQSRAERGSKARKRRKKKPGMTRLLARQSETKSDRRLSDSDLTGCGRLRQGAPDGDGRYSALYQMACIGARMTHLTTKTKRDIGAALELKRQSATCNGGKCRETRRTARRWRCSRDGLAPKANLKIAERCED